MAVTVPLIWFAALRLALPLTVARFSAPEVTTPLALESMTPPDDLALSVRFLEPASNAAFMTMLPPFKVRLAFVATSEPPTVTLPD